MKGRKNKIAAALLILCMMLTMLPVNMLASVGSVEEGILYQLNSNSTDLRLVAYVDTLEEYSSVAFTLTIDGKTSKELASTTAFEGLYADEVYYSTKQIYGEEGYFVTYVINRYLDLYAGKEVTITVKYAKANGEVVTDERTVTIGEAEVEMEPVTVTGNLTFANKYDWSTDDDGNYIGYKNQIFVYASSDETASAFSMYNGSSYLYGWFYGIVFEYDETEAVWRVTSVDLVSDGTNTVETETLGDNKFVVIYHAGSAENQADSYNFLYNYAVEGAEFTLSTDIATLQEATGALSDVYLSYTYYAPVEDDDTAEEEETGTPIEVPNGLAVYKDSDSTLKVAQFADLHFGTEGKSYHNNREERTLEYMQYIVDTQQPDLIVCSGDNIMTTGEEGLQEFIDVMESYQIPWTMIYGNHDAESTSDGYSRESLSEYLDTCDTEYLLYESGYVDTDNNRYGNFSISVLNESGTKLLGAIILLDGGTYNSDISSYDSITEGQIAWYESEIDELNALYTGEGTMPSIVFSHIQLPEHYTAYKAAQAGEGASFIIEQEMTDSYIENIRTGGPTVDTTDFFDTMVEKDSSVAFFCGHAHLFNFQVEMDGIVLGFGPQTGFSTLFPDNDLLRETYIYALEDNFEFTTISCKENGSNVGLAYSGTFDYDAEYDEASETYVASHNFNTGNYITFSYNGVRLTTDNTEFTGAFSSSTTSTGAGGFYTANGKSLYYDGTVTNSCVFTYYPEENTLNIEASEVEVDPDAPTSVSITSTNSDAGADAVAIWTTAGTEIRTVSDTSTGDHYWVGNGWRYYVVVDAEGKIAYAVLWPETGYGGPTGTSYYTHPDYYDYTTNPAISLLDGFADDWSSGGIGYNLFEIVIPEGGFAFTSHGEANYDVVDMLSQGTVDDYGVANINTRSLFKDNIRVTYDLEEGTISIYTE